MTYPRFITTVPSDYCFLPPVIPVIWFVGFGNLFNIIAIHHRARPVDGVVQLLHNCITDMHSAPSMHARLQSPPAQHNTIQSANKSPPSTSKMYADDKHADAASRLPSPPKPCSLPTHPPSHHHRRPLIFHVSVGFRRAFLLQVSEGTFTPDKYLWIYRCLRLRTAGSKVKRRVPECVQKGDNSSCSYFVYCRVFFLFTNHLTTATTMQSDVCLFVCVCL